MPYAEPCMRPSNTSCSPATPVGVLSLCSQAGASVAVVPGGWREGDYINSYDLVLGKRKGFIELAHGAAGGVELVPVLGIGEAYVVGGKTKWYK